MKSYLSILFTIISLNVFAQDTANLVTHSFKHKHIIGVGIGFPNAISRNYMRGNYADRSVFPVTYINYEYGITDNIGVKIDISFFRQSAGYEYANKLNNYATEISYNTITAYMINPQAVYYFFQNELIALSATVGVSLRNKTSDYSVNAYQNWKDEAHFGVIPSGKMGARIALGNSRLGLKLDVGYDWMSFMQFGLNYKL